MIIVQQDFFVLIPQATDKQIELNRKAEHTVRTNIRKNESAVRGCLLSVFPWHKTLICSSVVFYINIIKCTILQHCTKFSPL